MSFSLTSLFFKNARGVTFKDGSGVTWTFNPATNEITASAGGGYTPPVTTKGDLFGFSTVPARVPIGTDTFVLTADAAQG